MYEHFFGLRERPFDLNPNPRFLVATEGHREVLSNLAYAIASRKGLTLVLGEPGSGKTTLIRAVLQTQPERVHTVHIQNPTLSRDEFIETLAATFGLSAAAEKSKATMLRELEALLVARHAADEVSVLIVDEAQSLPMELLEEIRLLANIETDERKLLSVILAGQPELAERLNQPALRQLKQRVALRCELKPLSLSEAAGYIAGRVAIAGGNGGQIFTRDAVRLIHQASAGLPRTINVLADNVLLGAFAAGENPVGAGTVRDVCRDFSTTPIDDRESARRHEPVSQGPGGLLDVRPMSSPSSPASTAGTLFVSNAAVPIPDDVAGAVSSDTAPPVKRWLSFGRRHTRLFGN